MNELELISDFKFILTGFYIDKLRYGSSQPLGIIDGLFDSYNKIDKIIIGKLEYGNNFNIKKIIIIVNKWLMFKGLNSYNEKLYKIKEEYTEEYLTFYIVTNNEEIISSIRFNKDGELNEDIILSLDGKIKIK